MKIERTSLISGKTNTIEIPVTEEQLLRWEKGEALIQEIMPDLTPDQREFLMTGITPDEWDKAFKEED